MTWVPCLVRAEEERLSVRLGHPDVDDYLEFVAARARPNTLMATAFDLKVFFTWVDKEPAEVTKADVLAFITEQRRPLGASNVVRLADGEAGLSARTIRRRLTSISGLFAYLVARGDRGVAADPVPHGLAARRPGHRGRGMPLIRVPRTLPRVLEPEEVNALLGALRSHRDRAMVLGMLLGGLRRCEVLGLRLEDLHPGEKRVFVIEGKGGHERVVPISPRFFESLATYLETERPENSSTGVLFVVLKGRHRGAPLSSAGLDQILDSAQRRAGLEHLTCHELRHTCLTRLREAGMALEAVQAQAGHRSIESTRVYVHLSNSWLAEEYQRADELISADVWGAAG